jgi:hypothetical protein
MATTDQQLLTETQYATIETPDGGLTWASGLWTVAEVIAYANQRQRQFLRESGVVFARATLNTVPNTFTHPLPSDTIELRRVAWTTAGGVTTSLYRSASYEGDYLHADWPYILTLGPPTLFLDTESPTLTLRILPASHDNGVLSILYIPSAPSLANAGAVTLLVPDEYVMAIKYGILADMLSKLGRGRDPERAAYAESRFALGVEAAKVLLKGFTA